MGQLGWCMASSTFWTCKKHLYLANCGLASEHHFEHGICVFTSRCQSLLPFIIGILQTQHLAMSEMEEMIRHFLSETLRSYPDVVPSVKALNEEEVELMSKTLEVHKDWNYQARFLESLHPDWKCDKPEQSGPNVVFLQQNMCLLQVMKGRLY